MNENDSSRTGRDPARHSKNQTIREAIKSLFRAAKAAITNRDVDDAKPQRRKKRDGDKGGQVVRFPRTRRIIHTVRGRYGALKVTGKTKGAAKTARTITRAANDATAEDAAFGEATAYLADMLEWLMEPTNDDAWHEATGDFESHADVIDPTPVDYDNAPSLSL